MLIEIFVLVFLCIFIGISQSVGIGGGPIINVILTIGLGIQMKQSIHITYLFLFGGSLAAVILNAKKKNPKTGGPLIDYNLIMMTLPMVFSGSLIGAVIKNFISELFLTIALSGLLIYLIITIALQWWKQLQQAKHKQIQLVETLNNDSKISVDLEQKSVNCNINPQELQSILNQQKNSIHWDKFIIVLFIFVITVLAILVRGKKGSFQSIIGINSCGIYGFLIIILQFSICLFASILSYNNIKKAQDKKQSFGYQFSSRSQYVTLKKFIMAMVSGILAGLVGASLGLGGAIILVPMWLKSGVDKISATSSSGPLIMFSAAISITIQLLCNNYHSYLFFTLDLILAFMASFLIKDLINFLTNKYNIKNIIYILILVIMVSSLGVLLPFQISKYIQNQQDFIRFGQFC